MTGAFGSVAGHFTAGVVGCDFVTGRTGSGAIFTTGGGGGDGGAVVLVGAVVGAVVGEVDGAGLCVCWQPHVTAASRPIDPSQAAALRALNRR
ncbi:hypothetical protein [Mycolicibacterium vulneris]|uniref:hypothetical protein n=1 Tax=Mycolicibacterium vulneris TaxID=547163 RepID=UPI0013FDDABF|nr:hypothetical protein [Mycolicibacterium vulneris]